MRGPRSIRSRHGTPDRPWRPSSGAIRPSGRAARVGAGDTTEECLAHEGQRLQGPRRAGPEGALRLPGPATEAGADIVGAAVHDEVRVYFVSMDNVLRALDAGTGAQRWKKPLPLRPIANLRRNGGKHFRMTNSAI